MTERTLPFASSSPSVGSIPLFSFPRPPPPPLTMVTPEKKGAPLCFFVLCEYLCTCTPLEVHPLPLAFFATCELPKICSAALIRGAKTVIYRLRLLLQAVGRSRGVNCSLLYKGRKSNFPLEELFFEIHPQSFPQNRKKQKKMRTNPSSSKRT